MSIEINDDLYPYSSVVHIKAYWGGEEYVGSGALIGPNDVLTASHVIYQKNLGGLADIIRVYPSYDPDDGPLQPYFEPYLIDYYPNFDPDGDGLIIPAGVSYSLEGSELDIALLSLIDNVGNVTGYFGGDPNFTFGPVSVVGYPAKYGFQPVYDEGFAQKVTYANYIEKISGLETNPGNSGGPIYYIDPYYGDPVIVGIVSTGVAITSLKEHWWWLTDSISSNDYRATSPTYSIVGSTSHLDEGSTIEFTINTTQLTEGTLISYTISGISVDDISRDSLTGFVMVDSKGQALIEIDTLADKKTEGTETLTLSVENVSSSVNINDTSKQDDPTYTYTYTPSSNSMKEGEIISFKIQTTNLPAGTEIFFRTSGGAGDDLSELYGTELIDENGLAEINLKTLIDSNQEEKEIYTITLNSGDWSVSEQFVVADVNPIYKTTVIDAKYNIHNILSYYEGDTIKIRVDAPDHPKDIPVTYSVSITSRTQGGFNFNDDEKVNKKILNYSSREPLNLDDNGSGVITFQMIDDQVDDISSSMHVYIYSVTGARKSVYIHEIIDKPKTVDTDINSNDVLISSLNLIDIETVEMNLSSSNETYTATTKTKLAIKKNKSDYTIEKDGTSWKISGSDIGTDTLSGFKRLEFSDGTLALDIDAGDTAGQAYRLYQAAFARTPDMPGVSYHMNDMEGNGLALENVANNFIASPEFKTKYGENPSDDVFIDLLYQNVLGRSADSDGLAFYTNHFTAGTMTRAAALIGFAESPENVTLVAPQIEDGIWLAS